MLFRMLLFVCLLVPGMLRAEPVIMVFGDSLSAAYGIAREEGWVMLLEQRLAQEHFNYRIVNASISGETTAGGVQRIEPAIAEHKPVIVILELGANDGLRGLPLTAMADNLEKIVASCQRRKVRVLLIGMQLPPNYGTPYTQKFRDSYATLAKRHKLAFVPFLLTGVEDMRYFQADTIHPTADAQPRIMENIWGQLQPMLRKK